MNLTKPQKLAYGMERFSGLASAIICGSMLLKEKMDIGDLKKIINEICRLNPALRIKIYETDGVISQEVCSYIEQDFNVLYFENKEELDAYAGDYAKKPLDFYGNLCEFKIVSLPEQHGVLIKLHHVIGDAWTVALLGSQFIKLMNGEEIEAHSYTEYVESENIYIQSKRYEKDKVFFLEQFKKCGEATYLNEKQAGSLNAHRKTFVIDAQQARLISTYVQQKGTSAFMLFAAILSVYINRVKMNAEKFYIGTAVLNRSGAQERNTAGMFVNTVPILMELENDKSFADNLSAISERALSVFRHQKLNYGDVLSAIRKEFGFTEKLYDVLISYQNATITGANVETTWYHHGSQNESLQFHIDDRDNEGVFRIHYDYLTEKFTEPEIERMHQHICNLLLDAIKDDTKKIYELSILSEEEKQQLLFKFNDTAVDYPKNKCVHRLIEEQVTRMPDNVALIACDKTLTYKELNDQANRIAHSLIERGVCVGDIVAFSLHRRSYLIATMLGILKAGAAYLPIDPDHPQDRIDYMLSDSSTTFFITEENVSELLCNNDCCNPEITQVSNNLCYCIYTSGSTGKPKGVMLKHSNVVNYVSNNDNNVVNSIIKKQYKSIVSVTTCGFDIFVTESLLPLSNGLSIVLANEEQAKIQGELRGLLQQHPVDVLQTTPSKLKTLIADEAKNDYLQRLKAIILGGEALEEQLLCYLKQHTSAKIYNIYGPTETTVWSTKTEM